MHKPDQPIAIVGLAYRAPGVGRKGLWDFLAEAKSAYSGVPLNRFDHSAFYHPDSAKAGCISSEGAHFLPEDVYEFDAPFFNIRPDEARAMDPQHRLLLECTFEAFENAGMSLPALAGSNTGVFAAIGSFDYMNQVVVDLPSASRWTAAGLGVSMFANRLSYFFDLQGPSVSMDTACASSSYAVHTACQSLRSGECSTAIAGASALLLGPSNWSFLDNIGALSGSGKSFSYDEKASGFGRGEGAVTFVLKRLSDAVKDQDSIRAVILNSACNHSGQSDGITMPRQSAQENLLRRVHADAGLNPADTRFVEGHGTGTAAGDPIEAGAIANVIAADRTADDPLYIGSLKSNFGHLEGASGMLGMVKAVLSIENGFILPNHAFEKFNERIPQKDKLRVARSLVPWPKGTKKQICVSSFGIGGSNSAVILVDLASALSSTRLNANGIHQTNGYAERAQEVTNGPTNGTLNTNHTGLDKHGTIARNEVNGVQPNDSRSPSRLFVFSAKSEASASSYLFTFKDYLDTKPDLSEFMADLSYTLGQRRTHFSHRFSAVASSVTELQARLATSNINRTQDHSVIFAFTGQGAQYVRMAIELWQYQAFARVMQQAEDQLRAMGASWSLSAEIAKPSGSHINNTAEISQPASTAVQLALLALLKTWGISSSIVLGHSSGEIAAAYAAGLLSLEEALAISYYRGKAILQLTSYGKEGAMLAMGISREDALAMIQKAQQSAPHYATVAAINGPRNVTISGDLATIEAVQTLAEAQGIFARRLQVPVAYHSEHMQSVANVYRTALESFGIGQQASEPTQEHPLFVSSVSGKTVRPGDTLGVEYWIQNLVQPVLFSSALECAAYEQYSASDALSASRTINLVIEIGPHSALKNPVTQTLSALRQGEDQVPVQFSYLSSLTRGTAADVALLDLAGRLFCTGYPLILAGLEPDAQAKHHTISSLPPYEWSRPERYVNRSRFVKETLHPGQPYHPLLGWKNIDHSWGTHTFRQVFTLDELPWLRDHNISGSVIFPMTAYLSLALEAVRKLSPTVPSSMSVRHLHVKRTLDIKEEERVEIVTQLKAAQLGTEEFSSTLWSFEISSWTESRGWKTHSYGQAEAHAHGLSEATSTMKASRELMNAPVSVERDAAEEYANLRAAGVDYGPSFMSMTRIRQGHVFSILDSELRNLDDEILPSDQRGSLVTCDPPTLDGHLQGIAPMQELFGTSPTLVPNYVTRLKISNEIPTNRKQKFTYVSRLLHLDSKAGTARVGIAAFAHVDGAIMPIAEWESVTLRSIATTSPGDNALSKGLPSSFYWDLKLALDFAGNETIAKLLKLEPAADGELLDRRKIDAAAVHYMRKALEEVVDDETSSRPVRISKFIDWARRLVPRMPSELEHLPSLLADAKQSGAQGEMICAIGENLVALLREEVQPLEIMLENGLLTRNYEEDKAIIRCSQALARYVGQLSETKPNLRLLEIGAGTASTTLPVLQALSHGDDKLPKVIEYVFTDVSPGFFESARQKLAKWSPRMTFKKLDISQDPLTQGFAAEDFDVVIAANVLHATPDIGKTLDRVRTVLKPNGKLLLVEGVTHPPLVMPYALLPGWWLTQDEYRSGQDGPALTMESWQSTLTSRGFSGVDFEIQDYPGVPEHAASMLCATRTILPSERSTLSKVTICGPFMSQKEEAFAEQVASIVSGEIGCSTTVKPFLELDPTEDEFCIVLDSPWTSIVDDIDNETFDVLKSVLLGTRTLLWVIPEGHPSIAAAAKGVLRTVRLEHGASELFSLEDVPRTAQGASTITNLVTKLRYPQLLGEEKEFVWQANNLCVPRMRVLPSGREFFAQEAGLEVQKTQNMWTADYVLELTVESTGSLDSIMFQQTDLLSRPVTGKEVLIRNEAAGVNFRDLLVILGSVPWASPGCEGVGTVVKTGSDVTDYQPGDRVVYISFEGCFANYIKVQTGNVCKLPDAVSIPEAAGIPVAYMTALMSLSNIAHLQNDESVLIHAASGAVGQACIVLAKWLGAGRIFVTAGSEAKRAYLAEEYGIPPSDIFSSRTADFRDGILYATNDKGVDVVVNSLSGTLLSETWDIVAECGRFVEIGKRDFIHNSHLAMRVFSRNATFSGIDLQSYARQRPHEMTNLLNEVVELLRQGVITPISPTTALPISNLATGLRKLQLGQNIGKIVATFGPEDVVETKVPPALHPKTDQILRSDATYLITGGTGGIGLSLGSWMLEHGARNVVLLGRSGSSRPVVAEWLARYSDERDIQVKALACDVGSHQDLKQALRTIEHLPPVRGVVHGALYLRDAILANSNFDDWKAIMIPRVRGALNLEELVTSRLDFFLALSSFYSSTGNIGQSIYSGTNTFFDAFAEKRTRKGLPTVSIAIPLVLEVGYAVEHGMAEKLRPTAVGTLNESQLLTVIKGAIIGSSSGANFDGKAVSLELAHSPDGRLLPWQSFHPRALDRFLNTPEDDLIGEGIGMDRNSTSANSQADPKVNLLEAITTKVSSITMIERDDVHPDAPLANLGLDSLVSVDLRNWIRRETKVELPLPTILEADNLRALTTLILSQITR